MTLTNAEPGLVKGLHHVSFTVGDLARSIDFYAHLGFGLRMRWSEGPELCEEGLGVPGADIELAQLDGHGITLELIEYKAPAGAREPGQPADVGNAHLGLVVDDIDRAADVIAKVGGTLVSVPQREQSADWAQFRDPDGIRIELVQPHEGMTPAGAELSGGDAT